jgi:hypothetical protein
MPDPPDHARRDHVTTEDRIAELAGKVIDARLALADAIRDACPGPHAYVQHRDHNPPWCKTCGRGEMGTRYGKPAADHDAGM